MLYHLSEITQPLLRAADVISAIDERSREVEILWHSTGSRPPDSSRAIVTITVTVGSDQLDVLRAAVCAAKSD